MRRNTVVNLLANLIWFIIYGFLVASLHFVIGAALCASIIFVPTGIQFLKIARYAAWPFGSPVIINFDAHAISNLLWIVLFGLWLAILHSVVGIVLSISLIGIPFARKCFKLAKLSFTPYGAKVG